MSTINIKRVKTSEIELKDRLVAYNVLLKLLKAAVHSVSQLS